MTVLKIQNIYLATQAARRDADFYQKALGAELRFADDDHWIQLAVGGNNLALAGPREAAVSQGAVTVYEVDDIDAHSQAIEQYGGKIEGRRDMGSHGRTLTFSDPSGNIGQLFQRT